MGERGPAPKPKALIELNGNAGWHDKDKLANTPQFSRDVIAPAWLDDVALIEWQRLAPAMIAQGLLTAGDAATFAAYCCAWSAFSKAAIELNSATDITTAQPGAATPIGEMRKAADLLHKLAKEFGFTPAARTRVVVEQIKGASKLADLEDKLFG
jgi:P27 family predicted phage terminase small subunit